MARRTGATDPSWPSQPVRTSNATVELRSDSDGVTLLIDGVESSHVDPADPSHLVFEYMQQMIEVLRVTHPGRQGLRAIHLGGAGCSLARAIDAQWHGARQLAVEIDAELARYVREWFDLPRSPRLRIRVGEAREVLQSRPPDAADVIVRDAFVGRSVPPHLRTLEFTRAVAQRLAPGGVYLANLADGPPFRDARREAATVAAVFGRVSAIAEPSVLRGRRGGNIVLVAAPGPLGPDLARRLRTLPIPVQLLGFADMPDFIAGSTPFVDDA